jgi:hypothetical protein
MYEQPEPRATVLRRVLWLVLWFIAILAIVWGLTWLIFLRNHSSKTAKDTPDTLKSRPHDSSNDTSKQGQSNTGNKANGSTNTNGRQTTPTGSTSTPTQLANTGAGDVVLPVVVASFAGSALYYIRLHRKVSLN